LVASLLATCSAPPSVLEQIAHIGELRVVTRNTPTAFYYGADEPRGIEYELVRGFAEKLGVRLRMYIGEQVHSDVANGKAHIAAANLSVADTRKHAIAFGSAYQTIEPQVIYRRGTKQPAEVAELRGARIEIAAGSSHSTLLEKMRADEPLLTWIEDGEAGTEELIRRVADGEVDYTIADSHEFAMIRHFYPEARVAFTLGEPNEVAWVLPKGADGLRETIAAYFAEIEATGELAAILDRYYAPSRDFDYVGSRAFVRHFKSRLPLYRELFREAAETTGTDWRLLAAMAYQESQRGLKRFCQPQPHIVLDLEAIHDRVDAMLFSQVECWRLVELVHLAIDACANKTLRHQICHQLHVLALAVADHRREQHQAGALGQCEHLVHHLADRLRFKVGVVIGASWNAGASIQQSQVVVNFGHCADCGTRVVRGRFLLDRDRRRQAVNVIDVGFLHHRQELSSVG
jgi:ABC-type amino acid transport substrate-binding protein